MSDRRSAWEPRQVVTKVCLDAIELITHALYGGYSEGTSTHYKQLAQATYNWSDREVAELMERIAKMQVPTVGLEDKPQ